MLNSDPEEKDQRNHGNPRDSRSTFHQHRIFSLNVMMTLRRLNLRQRMGYGPLLPGGPIE